MQKHVRGKHDKEVRYSYSDCLKKIQSKNHKYKVHKTLFKEEKIHVRKSNCKFCTVSCLSTLDIAIYINIEHPKWRLFDCDECGYRSN